MAEQGPTKIPADALGGSLGETVEQITGRNMPGCVVPKPDIESVEAAAPGVTDPSEPDPTFPDNVTPSIN